MKEKIYTIPVNDAYGSQCTCPLCELAGNIERNSLNYYLGASLMEPDTRIATNTKGFCGHHVTMMYNKEINRLGLGLMLHTHLMDLQNDIGTVLQKAAPANGTFLKGRDRDYKKNLENLANHIDSRADSCIICEKIEYTMDRYLDVLLWMFFEEPHFRQLFETKRYHCLPHVAFLLRGAAKYLTQNQAGEFVRTLSKQQASGMNEMISDIEWFTLKFDYRNKEKPWGNSKTAIPRAISLLSDEGGTEDGTGK